MKHTLIKILVWFLLKMTGICPRLCIQNLWLGYKSITFCQSQCTNTLVHMIVPSASTLNVLNIDPFPISPTFPV